MPKAFSGLVGPYKGPSQFEKDLIEAQTKRYIADFKLYLVKNPVNCPGCGGKVLQTDLHHHELLGCEVAKEIGRGPIQA